MVICFPTNTPFFDVLAYLKRTDKDEQIDLKYIAQKIEHDFESCRNTVSHRCCKYYFNTSNIDNTTYVEITDMGRDLVDLFRCMRTIEYDDKKENDL